MAKVADLKVKYERAMMKIDCLKNEQLIKEIENNVRYRIDTKV